MTDTDSNIVSFRGGKRGHQIDMTAITTSLAALYGSDFAVSTIHIVNTTASAITITLEDKASTPNVFLSSYSLAANSFVTLNFYEPILFHSGIQVQGSATGASISVKGYLPS